MRRLSELRRAAPPAIIALAATVLVVGFGVSGTEQRSLSSQASSWRGLVGGAHPSVNVRQRVLVVLRSPSMAQRVALNGGVASQQKERTWTRIGAGRAAAAALGAEHARDPPARPVQLLARAERVLGAAGRARDRRARAPPRGGRRLPGASGVPGLGLVELLGKKGVALGASHLPALRLPGYDGRGVTIALLDTGVDRAQPYLRGRVLPGIDIVGGDADATAAADPSDSSRLERHGTEMAGILVGAGGPGGVTGIAPGAAVLPIRVAGWQQDLTAAGRSTRAPTS